MKRSGFKPKSLDEIRAKQAEKRAKAKTTKKTTKKRTQSKLGTNKRKSQSLAKLKKELDRVFSLYIRNKYADENGNVQCYTCGKWLTVKTIQNGHFVSRQYLATRWDENNCRPQCAGCNIFGNGKPFDFEERLKAELGDEAVEKMKKKRHEVVKLNRQWYEEQITHYKNLL